MLRDFIAQPVPRAPDDLDMRWPQPRFFLEFAVHGLFRRFSVLDTTLRKLPGVFSNPFAPPHLIVRIKSAEAAATAAVAAAFAWLPTPITPPKKG